MKNCNILIESSLQNLKLGLVDLNWDQFVVSIIEVLMQIERKEYLAAVGQNKANGYYSRSFKSLLKNRLLINVPRTRNGDFSPTALEIVKLNSDQVNELCLSLYRKGMTSKDVSDLMEELFGESVSKTKIVNLAGEFNEIRRAWENTPLETYYKVMFCDCIFVTVRRIDQYAREAVYISYGVREDNYREIISIDINPEESAGYWSIVYQNIKKRGVKDIDLIVADGLTGLEDVVHKEFPETDFQKCCIHKIRNVMLRARASDKKEIAEDLKKVFDNFGETSSEEKAKRNLVLFLDKWGRKYPSVKKMFDEGKLEYYFTYIKYPPEVRRMIYTTNSIENMNRLIRKGTKNKLSFESPERLLDYIFVILKDFEASNLMKYKIYEFNKM
jgi:putative transposase